MTILERFGANVKMLRQARGLSQEDLAELAGLHRTYVGGIERGERNVSLLNIVRIARVLRHPIADLFKDIDMEDGGEA